MLVQNFLISWSFSLIKSRVFVARSLHLCSSNFFFFVLEFHMYMLYTHTFVYQFVHSFVPLSDGILILYMVKDIKFNAMMH